MSLIAEGNALYCKSSLYSTRFALMLGYCSEMERGQGCGLRNILAWFVLLDPEVP